MIISRWHNYEPVSIRSTSRGISNTSMPPHSLRPREKTLSLTKHTNTLFTHLSRRPSAVHKSWPMLSMRGYFLFVNVSQQRRHDRLTLCVCVFIWRSIYAVMQVGKRVAFASRLCTWLIFAIHCDSQSISKAKHVFYNSDNKNVCLSKNKQMKLNVYTKQHYSRSKTSLYDQCVERLNRWKNHTKMYTFNNNNYCIFPMIPKIIFEQFINIDWVSHRPT